MKVSGANALPSGIRKRRMNSRMRPAHGGEKDGGVARPRMEQVRVSLVVVFSNQPGSRAFSLGARLFAFYKFYSQKRNAAEMRCVDKRNFQT